MNIIEPTQWDSYYDLVVGGRVYFGRSTFGEGLKVGLPPIVAKFEGLEPDYPSELFVIKSYKIMLAINKEMTNSSGFIPDWLRADCYEYFWNQSKNRTDLNILKQ